MLAHPAEDGLCQQAVAGVLFALWNMVGGHDQASWLSKWFPFVEEDLMTVLCSNLNFLYGWLVTWHKTAASPLLMHNIDDLVQDCGISSANALEIP